MALTGNGQRLQGQELAIGGAVTIQIPATGEGLVSKTVSKLVAKPRKKGPEKISLIAEQSTNCVVHVPTKSHCLGREWTS